MIEFISDFFIKKCKNNEKIKNRQILGIVCSVFGILLNILMFLLKITSSMFSGSIAAAVDAVHNLTDSASSVVTLLSFILSGQKKTEKYPMGKGRIEYVAGFIVSAVLISAGIELAETSVSKIINPESVTFSLASVILLSVSVVIKIYMAYFNFRTAKKISSEALSAAATDCLCDSISTIIALTAVIAVRFTDLNIDAWGGFAVSLFIFSAGIKSAKDTIKTLIGTAPDETTISKIRRIISRFPEIEKTGNVILHDYGPENRIITAEAFFCDSSCLSDITLITEKAENSILADTGYTAQLIIRSSREIADG